MSGLAIAAGGAAAALLLLAVLPRILLTRSQDRLAKETMEQEGPELKLLTRAELVRGRYRRLPGILALREDRLEFTGVFGESVVLPTVRIQKIATGERLGSGRQLFRRESLRLTRSSGEDVEFLLHPASAFAWRSHLGAWAMKERSKPGDLETVVPGRK